MNTKLATRPTTSSRKTIKPPAKPDFANERMPVEGVNNPRLRALLNAPPARPGFKLPAPDHPVRMQHLPAELQDAAFAMELLMTGYAPYVEEAKPLLADAITRARELIPQIERYALTTHAIRYLTVINSVDFIAKHEIDIRAFAEKARVHVMEGDLTPLEAFLVRAFVGLPDERFEYPYFDRDEVDTRLSALTEFLPMTIDDCIEANALAGIVCDYREEVDDEATHLMIARRISHYQDYLRRRMAELRPRSLHEARAALDWLIEDGGLTFGNDNDKAMFWNIVAGLAEGDRHAN